MPPGTAARQCEKLAAWNTCHTFQNFKTGNQVIFSHDSSVCIFLIEIFILLTFFRHIVS